MPSYYVNINLPRISGRLLGVVTTTSPSGDVTCRHLEPQEALWVNDPEEYAIDLVCTNFPEVKGKVHGDEVIHHQTTDTSAQIVLVRVDVDS